MYHFNQESFTRPYSVDLSNHKTLPSGTIVVGMLADCVAQEVLAYLRGEDTTEWILDCASRLIGVGRSTSRSTIDPIVIEYEDGSDYSTGVNIATACRHYELFSDLHELDPSARRFKMPFSPAEMRSAMLFGGVSVNCNAPAFPLPLACLRFLRPKRMETYLQYIWRKEDMSEGLFREIGSGLEKETRMHLGRFSSTFPDYDLYPIIDWATRTRSNAVLSFLLKEKAPSVLLCCFVMNGSQQEACDLIKEVSFTDKALVIVPSEFKSEWEKGLGDGSRDQGSEGGVLQAAAWQALDTTNDPILYRKLLALFNITSSRIGNLGTPVSSPFGLTCKRSYKGAKYALEGLHSIDATFTETLMAETLWSFV